jgi:hypothetical protein
VVGHTDVGTTSAAVIVAWAPRTTRTDVPGSFAGHMAGVYTYPGSFSLPYGSSGGSGKITSNKFIMHFTTKIASNLFFHRVA